MIPAFKIRGLHEADSCHCLTSGQQSTHTRLPLGSSFQFIASVLKPLRLSVRSPTRRDLQRRKQTERSRQRATPQTTGTLREDTWHTPSGPQRQREGHDQLCESSRKYSVHQSPAKTDLSDLWTLLQPQQRRKRWQPTVAQ